MIFKRAIRELEGTVIGMRDISDIVNDKISELSTIGKYISDYVYVNMLEPCGCGRIKIIGEDCKFCPSPIILELKNSLFQNYKTGDIYLVTNDTGINCTNGEDDPLDAIIEYIAVGKPEWRDKVFYRKKMEFIDKFAPLYFYIEDDKSIDIHGGAHGL